MPEKIKTLRPWNVKPGMKIRLYDSTGATIRFQDEEISEVEPWGHGEMTGSKRYRLTFKNYSAFWRGNYAIFYSYDKVEIVIS